MSIPRGRTGRNGGVAVVAEGSDADTRAEERPQTPIPLSYRRRSSIARNHQMIPPVVSIPPTRSPESVRSPDAPESVPSLPAPKAFRFTRRYPVLPPIATASSARVQDSFRENSPCAGSPPTTISPSSDNPASVAPRLRDGRIRRAATFSAGTGNADGGSRASGWAARADDDVREKGTRAESSPAGAELSPAGAVDPRRYAEALEGFMDDLFSMGKLTWEAKSEVWDSLDRERYEANELDALDSLQVKGPRRGHQHLSNLCGRE